MVGSSDVLNIYWSPSMLPENESWSFYYREPIPVLSPLRKIQNKEAKDNFFACPATTNLFSNIYRIDCPASIDIKLSKETINEPYDATKLNENNQFILISGDSPISIYKHRKNNIDGYMSCLLNMSWMFFAEEPVTMRLTPPYFPSIMPANGALLASGEFDIGSWYRPVVLDYHIPVDSDRLIFKENDPLFFLEFKTHKKIVLNRYHLTPRLLQLKQECLESPKRYGRFKPLRERYEMARKSNFRELVLTEIKNNLVDRQENV